MATTPGASMSCVICGDKNLSRCPGDSDVGVENLNQVFQQLGVQYNPTEVSLCDGCYSGVVKAEGRREKAAELERDVRSLQLIILKMMRRLESLQEKYLEEIKVLQQKIRKPEEVPVGGNGSGNTEEIAIEALAIVKQEILDLVEDPGGFEEAVTEGTDASTTPPAGSNHLLSDSGMGPDADVLELPAIKEEIDPTDFVQVSLLTSENCAQEDSVSFPVLDTRSNLNGLVLPVVTVSTASQTTNMKTRAARNGRSAPCRWCGKTFHGNSNLRRHLNAPTGPLCSKKRDNLKRHLSTHGRKNPSRMQHQKTHVVGGFPQAVGQVPLLPSAEEPVKSLAVVEKEGNLPVAPTTDPLSSVSKTKTKKTRAPRVGRSAPCPHCGKTFTDNWNLNRHILTHMAERPHKCPQCPAAFRDRSNLNQHLLTHSGEKPFKCPHCPKGFTRNDYLEKHNRRHTGERPYSCSVCGQRFAEKRNLKTHFKKVHSASG